MSGPRGGLSALPLDFEEVLSAHEAECVGQLLPALPCVYKAATGDVFFTTRHLFRQPRRRACPSHSVPSDIWLVTLRPGYFTKPDTNLPITLGEWHPSNIVVPESAIGRHMYFELCVHVRRAQCAPLLGNLSAAWQLDRHNQTSGTKRLRYISGLCALCRAYHRGLYAKHGRPAIPSYDHGSAPGRRMEEAMASAGVVVRRLRQVGYWFVVGSKDVTNAVACGSHDSIRLKTNSHCDEGAARILWARRARSVIRVSASDGNVELLSGSGGLRGDGNAPDELLTSFFGPTSQWVTDTYLQRRPFIVRCKLFDEVPHDCSLY